MAEHKGIDVSRYQSDIDFNKVKDAGYKFVIAKCTEGSEAGSKIIDPFYKNNIAGAKAAGLAVHAYHFFRGVSEADARAEADWMLKNLTRDEDYLFCDVEAASLNKDPDELTEFVNAFFDQLFKAGKKKLGIYSGKSFFENRLIESKLHPGLLIWIARYNSALGRNAHIWQHTSSAQVPGIAGKVDENIAYTDAILSGEKQADKPASKPKPAEKKPSVPDTYKVKAGDMLSSIASRYGLSVQSIAALNGIKNVNLIYPGQKLRLKKASAKKSKPKASGSAVVPYPGHLIKRGSTGKDVIRVQNAVNVKADGIFGPATEKAVRAYQKRHRLSVDGIVGKQTWNTLF